MPPTAVPKLKSGKWQEDPDKLTFIILATDKEPRAPGVITFDQETFKELQMVGDVNLFLRGQLQDLQRELRADDDEDENIYAELEIMIAGAHSAFVPPITLIFIRAKFSSQGNRQRSCRAHAELCNWTEIFQRGRTALSLANLGFSASHTYIRHQHFEHFALPVDGVQGNEACRSLW